jgi:ATPase subunit of ABC transporter with duplicated ATPase domains
MVQITKLTMRFGSRILFEGINLKLDRHKRYGLIGANGAGKNNFFENPQR